MAAAAAAAGAVAVLLLAGGAAPGGGPALAAGARALRGEGAGGEGGAWGLNATTNVTDLAWEEATEAVDGEVEPYPGVEFLGIEDPEDAGGSPDVPAEGIMDGFPSESEVNVEVPAEGLMEGFNNDTAGSPDVPAEGIMDDFPSESEATVEIPAEGYIGPN